MVDRSILVEEKITQIVEYLNSQSFKEEDILKILECYFENNEDDLYFFVDIKHINVLSKIMVNNIKEEDILIENKINLLTDKKINIKLNNVSFKNKENGFAHEIILTNGIEENTELIQNTILENKFVIIRGGTGLGKTTKIPFLLNKNYKKICCSQPRRIAAISVAQRVAAEHNWKLGGQKIGYKVRFDAKCQADTQILYMTDGLLLNEIIINTEKFDSKYDIILIDESHERNQNIDLLLGYLKNYLKHTKLVIMSATLESEKFLTFFQCPILTFMQKSFEVEEHYLEEEVEYSIELCVEKAIEIVKDDKNANILVFLPGRKDIEDSVEITNSYLSGTNIKIFPLYSTLTKAEQERVFQKADSKIIFSTNIAETSITIPEITHVIDSGLFKEHEIKTIKYEDKEEIREYGASSLNTRMISKSQAKQRAGRAGRVQNGHVYRMYTRQQYENMEEHMKPQILLVDLSQSILNCLAMGIKNIFEFDFMDMPKEESIKKALNELYIANAINSEGTITPLGLNLAKLPLDHRMGLSLIKAKKLGCFNKVATIFACFLAFPILNFYKNTNPEFSRMKHTHRGFITEKGMLYFYADIFEKWVMAKKSPKWANKHYVRQDSLLKAFEIKMQFMKLFNGFEPDTSNEIEVAISTGFFTHVARRNKNKYLLLSEKSIVDISYNDFLFSKKPKYIVYFELFAVKENESYMKHCLQVTERDLDEALNNWSKK
ncbi:prp22 [Ecytonucleospora hepatopenaei]|uniref:Prp22 n=1 Tax=Ecytonucleospora hepatopenaei TaxID=646526 RepID=A0A1W0E7B3_9MICR|nr:prp22 [Ecytonucleospora hepatopenaei]